MTIHNTQVTRIHNMNHVKYKQSKTRKSQVGQVRICQALAQSGGLDNVTTFMIPLYVPLHGKFCTQWVKKGAEEVTDFTKFYPQTLDANIHNYRF